MKLITLKIDNKRLLIIFLCALLCFFCLLDFLSVKVQGAGEKIEDNASRLAFIRSLGVEPYEKAIEVKQVTIPEKFGEVYLRYNELQKLANYNLADYCGQTVTVYRYKIPELNGTQAFVNLMILNGEIIGGDISSVELNGFMLPLKEIE